MNDEEREIDAYLSKRLAFKGDLSLLTLDDKRELARACRELDEQYEPPAEVTWDWNDVARTWSKRAA